ncbi:PREDICTED: linker for activation of T-cells family member 2 [Aptenodytes forsteri]|uniref:linker for activation of T-cells family member 2 n=1 Tax=Aptenodytes forsteri TaxID=9233 RepID=UPI0004F45F96|nr:PREDICTED: linker for activation of T-cells family member 2 [Aptenodytes forsteri]
MAQLELLWAAAALMLLGATVSLCIKCQLSATKREKQSSERRSQKTTKELGASCRAGYGCRTEFRYQNFLTEDCLRGDIAYVEPISLDYYNCAQFFTPPNEKEEDSHSYQNIITGVSHGSDPDTDDAADYENSVAIHIWKLQQAEALQTESLDDEPDYINTDPASGPAPLSKQK